MPDLQDYHSVINAYTGQLRGLFEGLEQPAGMVTRGGATPQPQTLAERSEVLAGASRQVGEMTGEFLESQDRRVREAAELKLLAQAGTELEVARQLFALAEAEQQGGTASTRTRAAAATPDLQQPVEDLIKVLEAPLDKGLDPFTGGARRGFTGTAEAGLAENKQRLKKETQNACTFIYKTAGRVGGLGVKNLLLLDPKTITDGVGYLSKDFAGVIDSVITGFSEVVMKLVKAGVKLVLQAYEWLSALLGKQVEQKVREKVSGWLDELKEEQKVEGEKDTLFTGLLSRLYGMDKLETDLDGWLAQSQAEAGTIGEAADQVRGLSAKYKVKAEWAEKCLKVLSYIKNFAFFKVPQVAVGLAAIMLGMAGYVVFAGYDYFDSGRALLGIPFPDRVEGACEIARKALAV